MRVVYTDVTDLDPTPGVRQLEDRGFEVRVLDADCPQDRFEEEIRAADAVVCGYRALPGELMEQAPKLGIVATLSVGTDMVDVEAATRLGIRVCNVPPIASEEVATHTLALMLAQERRLAHGVEIVREGRWDAHEFGAPRRLSELTLGLIGFGRIGRRFAGMASPLFKETLVYDPFLSSQPDIHASRSASLAEVIAGADVISLHLPLTEHSRSLLGAEEFAAMKPGVGILNVSRGALIDHEALGEALASGQVRYAGLDVTDPEPLPADAALRRMPNVAMTPHVAFASDVTRRDYVLAPVEEILAWQQRRPAISPVNSVA